MNIFGTVLNHVGCECECDNGDGDATIIKSINVQFACQNQSFRSTESQTVYNEKYQRGVPLHVGPFPWLEGAIYNPTYPSYPLIVVVIPKVLSPPPKLKN